MLAAVITGPTIEAAQEMMEKFHPFADLFELRLDSFEEEALSKVDHLLSQSPLPFIFTFRKKEQGGFRSIAEEERLLKIEKLLQLHPAYCDIEADTDPKFIERLAKKFPNVKLIGSHHDFEKTPKDLKALLQEMKNPHFSVYKIASRAESTLDLLKLMIFARENSKNLRLSCIAMGEMGQPSRVLGPIVGNFIDYAGEEQSVLFQYSPETLHELFHYSSLNRETEIFALIGNPINHSPGDRFHNEIFRKEKRNAVYVKLHLDVHELKEFMHLLPKLPFKGLSVTIPLKEAIVPLLDQIDPIASAIGAVNTVTINGSTLGTNTDAPGALNAIEKHFKVAQKKVAILGAGGSARAIAYEAKKRGAFVMIFNRTFERAKAIASDLDVKAYRLDEIGAHSFDLLINTTPPSGCFDADLISKADTVMDINYFPKETPILKEAKRLERVCIYGEEMFVEQAKLQQKAWTL